MAVTIRLGTFSKRRNSTKQPTDTQLPDVRTVNLKDATSYDAPTFLLTGNDFAYNYLKWGSRYYFIRDIRSVRNNLVEVECVLDPLATYKTDILAGTQYVCYSSQSGNSWLPDTRIPILRSTHVGQKTESLPFINRYGAFILSVVGDGDPNSGAGGCEIFAVNRSTLNALIHEISTWQSDAFNAATALISPQTYQGGDFGDAITSLNNTLASLGNAILDGGLIGNAYQLAPQCIRSCIWVPFDITYFTGSSKTIYLGTKSTNHAGFKVDPSPFKVSVSIDIPWHYNDWRRSYCEDVYLYLPLVGMIGLSSDNLTHASSITVKISATATDGNVCYEIISGNEIIGTYGGNASTNYPIGINQQASSGDVISTAIHGVEHAVSEAVDAGVNVITAGGELVAGLTVASIDTANVALSTNLTTLGGIGGGAGCGLDLDITCYTVAHDTVVNPNDMKTTMGLPTMKPLQLSTLTGFCQCANAHVDAPATADELSAIDMFLNSGFYIE